MSETITTADSVSAEELAAREKTAELTRAEALIQRGYELAKDEFNATLDAALDAQPKERTTVPVTPTLDSPTPVARISSPVAGLYRRMPADVREWRTEDSDHWYAEWIRGLAFKDRAQMALAEAKLDEMFGRADTLMGASDATGAFADGTGATLLPRPLENVVLIARDRVAKMRRFAANFNMTTQMHNVPTAAAMTAAMVGEVATAAQGEPTLAQVPFTSRKCQVRAVASNEMLADSAINIVSLYAERAGTAIGKTEDDQFWALGGGADEITAIIAPTGYSEGTSTVLDHADILAMYYAVSQVDRTNAAWYGAPNVLALVAGVLDAVSGRPFFQGMQERVGPISDDPTAVGTLMGKPVYEVPLAAGSMIFGDVSRIYMVGSRSGIVAAASEHVGFADDTVMFKWTTRFDGNNIDVGAGRVVAGITSAAVVGS